MEQEYFHYFAFHELRKMREKIYELNKYSIRAIK